MTAHRIRAAVVHSLGAAPRFEWFPAPEAREGASVVTVGAAALKPSDRLAAAGVHYAPAGLPFVTGLDGVGRLADGTRVGFMMPVQPYGGMAEQTLVPEGQWLPVPDGVDDATAAALLNPGMAAWKTVIWEGRTEPGDRVLILGATSTAGRIAARLAILRGASVVVAGRDGRGLDELVGAGALAAVRVDRPREELVAELVGHGPYDLVADFLWGAPAEAALAAVATAGAGGTRDGIRYIVVGMAAGEDARIPAIAIRRAPVHLFGSGAGRPLSLAQAADAFAELLEHVRVGRVTLEFETVPLSGIEAAWSESRTRKRVVVIPGGAGAAGAEAAGA